ncbi:MAG: hypothetical protein ACI3XQ_05385 [Eubacteriales bacterium]
MKKLIPLRKVLFVIGVVLTVITSILFLILGNPAQKVSTILATFIAIPLVYLFIRFMFYILGKKATNKMLTAFLWFFMIAGIVLILMGLINFFASFPSNTTPLISAGFTLVVSVLYGQANQM